MNTFINIHVIQTLPPNALNRDDSGVPKKVSFGGVERSRISSQSWKYAMREFFSENGGEQYVGYRSTQLPVKLEERIKEAVPDVSEKILSKIVSTVSSVINKLDSDSKTNNASKMLIFYSPVQFERLVESSIAVANGEKKSITVDEVKGCLLAKNSVDLALFGRMMTAYPELSVKASANIAHVLGVEPYKTQRDSFVGKDDELEKVKIMGTTGFVTSTFYRYGCLDTNLLLENLDGDVKLTKEAIGVFLNAFVKSIPSGKQSSFAARTLPSFIMVSLSHNQPVSLANAFGNAIVNNIEENAITRLVDEADGINQMYDSEDVYFYASTKKYDVPFAEKKSFSEVVKSVKEGVEL